MDSYLENLFTHHRPLPEQIEKYERIRSAAKQFASLVRELTPTGTPEGEIAIERIREAVMWANASIACHGK